MSELAESLGLDLESPVAVAAMHLARADADFQYELRAARESSGLSRTDVAERMGVNVEVVEELEAYWADPHLSLLRRYALAIGVVYTHSLSMYTTNPEDQIGANVD